MTTVSADGSGIDVVMRCRNEMPHVERALEALRRQSGPPLRVLFVDCRSTDGSREAAARAGVRIHDWNPRAYVPGVVLNTAMRMTSSEVVAFINADAVALHEDAVAQLVAPLLEGSDVAATWGRQMPRPDADPWTRADYLRAFPAGAPLQTRFGRLFSMAASAVRRSAWEQLEFDPHLRYSEDVDWTKRIGALGWRLVYVPRARFEHSHAYDLRGHYRRRAGEGEADARIHHLGPPSVVTDLVRPLTGSVLRDVRAAALQPRSVAARVAQAAGYYAGRRRGARP
ncbi:MAG: glycosyltransferase family 2 protein [Polyangiales bacterium]